MSRIAIVGDAVSISGFRPLGLDVHALERPGDVRALWPRLMTEQYAVIFITEPVYAAAADLISEIADQPTPAITVIPGMGSAGGVGGAKLDKAIERALGTKMPVRDEES